MGYGKLGPSDPGGNSKQLNQSEEGTSYVPPRTRNRKKLIFLSIVAIALIVASAVSAVLFIGVRNKASGPGGSVLHHKPTQAISRTCSKTRFPSLCVNSLLDFPGSLNASEQDLVHISFNMTLQHISKALYFSSGISYFQMDPHVRSAYDDCVELLDDSVEALSRALTSVVPSDGTAKQLNGGSIQDVMTWLSAALTNQDTCTEGFSDLRGNVKDQMGERLNDLSELVSNCLAIFAGSDSDDFAGIPIQNRRRLLEADITLENAEESGNFPRWLDRRERKLLALPVAAIQADIVVSKDGNGTCKTIAEAIKKAPQYSSRRTIIYVRAGR